LEARFARIYLTCPQVNLGVTSIRIVEGKNTVPLIPGFISYASADRRLAARVKAALLECGVDGFMAHEDIHVSQEWRDRILEELRRMEVFVPLLSAHFKSSDWTSQESGAACVRDDVLIIPASLDGTVPYGFLNRFQGQRLPQPVTAEFFRGAIARQKPHAIIKVLMENLDGAASFRGAERLMEPLVPFFNQLTIEEANGILDMSIGNSQIWDAGTCRVDYLPKLLSAVRGKADQRKIDQLADMIT
jgi:hypothetical protein